jgi:SAM-dependent MidA family methyltransferase
MDVRESALYRTIVQEIRDSNKKAIPFRDFMELALYAKNGGYYNKEAKKIGKQGDFYTNSSVGAVYGETLADAVWDMLRHEDMREPCYIVEMGGGDGSLSFQLLSRLQQLTDEACERKFSCIMIEASAYHKALQEKKLAPFQGQISIAWYGTIEEARKDVPHLNGVFISNELPDAFPVHLIECRKGKWHEIYVALNERDQFIEQLKEPAAAVLDYVARERIPQIEGYRTEVNLAGIQWMKEVGRWLEKGYAVTIDYGYEREILYEPARKEGTLLCYQGHTMNSSPYLQPGEQDITAHVNFSALMDTGAEQGMRAIGLYSQREFLLRAGILKRLQEHASVDPFLNETAKRNRAVRQLIMPGGMGDTFRVLVQEKGLDMAEGLNFLK